MMKLTRVQLPLFKAALPLALFILLSAASGCTYLFFKPSKEFITSPEVQNYSPRDVYFKSSDGLTLHGWYFRAREERGTVLICHGNVENLSTHVKLDYPGRDHTRQS